ncbi:MAG: hypothetical protein DELT_01176 [Desulfovibrio sp.]
MQYVATFTRYFAIAFSLFHLYLSCFGIMEAWMMRAIHVLSSLTLAYLCMKRTDKLPEALTRWLPLVCIAAIAVFVAVDYEDILWREGVPELFDSIAATILALLLIDAARRWLGNPMAIVCTAFFAYAMFGHYLPGILASPNYSYERLVSQLFNSTGGIMGTTTHVAATNVVMFIIFGAFLQASGAGDFFNDAAIIVTKNVTGGPAKAAILASLLVGTIQGSAISNVATTGPFTIPLMKRAGYKPHFAAAVEATASTGGMIMPPVMGAAAFLLAEMTRTPYGEVMLYALVPAILYYVGVFVSVHLRALKDNLKPTTIEFTLDKKVFTWMGINAVVPIAVLLGNIIAGFSPMRSATLAIGSLILIWIIRPNNRMTLKNFLDALESGAKSMIPVSVACAAAGIVVGFVSLTGLGTKIAILVTYFQSYTILVLIMSMVTCIILGMGLPVAASYVIAAVTLGGVFIKTGIPLVPGHLFLMYFATLSAITPPVALASYAAAGIADAHPDKTGWAALRLALPGFIVPFAFVFGPALMLIGTPAEIANAVFTAVLGIIALAVATEGWMFTEASWLERGIFAIIAIMLISVEPISSYIGLAVFAILTVLQYRRQKRRRVTGAA